MLNISLDGDTYVLNIKLPNTKFNFELLERLVGMTTKKHDSCQSQYRSKDSSQVFKMCDKLLTILKLLNYG